MEQSFEEIRPTLSEGTNVWKSPRRGGAWIESSMAEQNAGLTFVREQLTQIEALYNQARQRIENAVSNPDGAIQFIIDGDKKHPNRIDICLQGSSPGGTKGEFAVGRQTASAFSQPSSFGAPSAAQPSPFGAPHLSLRPALSASRPLWPNVPAHSEHLRSANQHSLHLRLANPPSLARASDSRRSSAARLPSVNQSQLGGSSAFGQPATLGAKPNPFGAPAFGQPAQPVGAAGGFGQPSALGQKPQSILFRGGIRRGGGGGGGASPFANPAAGAAGATPSPFGQPAQNPGLASPFGQPAQNQNASPFGQPAQAQTPSSFGQPANNAVSSNTSPFGQPASTGCAD